MGIADTIAECVISCRYVESVEVIPLAQNFLDRLIKEKTEQIIADYEGKAKIYQEQIYNRQIEINKKDALLKVKEKIIKDSEIRISHLQAANAELVRRLNAISLPTTPEETKYRLKELGYAVCR